MRPIPMILAIAIALFASAGVLAWPQTRGAAGTNGPVGETLEALQRLVMDFGGTEPAFNNAFWDNHAPGIYVEARTGEPLFVSSDKFDSGSGWPSFTRPVNPDSVTLRTDRTHGMVRTEVRSAQGGAHLGHVFNDGPRARRSTLVHQFVRAAFYSTRRNGRRRLRAIHSTRGCGKLNAQRAARA